jgi:hypothetical protein
VADIALAVAEARTQTILMMILMTGHTLFGFNGEIIAHIGLRPFHMAFFTLMFGVRTQQGIAGFLLMVKGFGWLPLFRRVAEAAFVLLEFALIKVHIIFHMALVAGVHKAGITDFAIAGRLTAALGRMALLAVGLDVRTIQLKPCFAMIKGLGIDEHRVEIPALMILMTIDAGLVIHESMEVLFRIHVFTNFLMAIQAVFVGNTTGRLMTFEAIVMRMLQLVVTEQQRPGSQKLVEETFKFHLGGILRQGRGCTQKKKGYDECELSHLTFPQIVPVGCAATRPKHQTCNQTL